MITSTTTNDDNYLASVSDIMSGLIFIFIITLMVFSLQLKGSQEDQLKEIEKLKEKIRQNEILKKKLEAETLQYKRLLELLTNARAIRDNILKSIESSLAEKGFQVKVDTDHGLLSLPEQVLFPSGSDKLQPKGQEILKLLASILDQNLQTCTYDADGKSIFTDTELPNGITPSFIESVFIEGHTDNVPVGKKSIFRDNWDLSTARSLATFKTLIEAKPQLNARFNETGYPIFSVCGYAEFRPVASNDTDEGRSLNRRIDIRIIMSPPKKTKTGSQELINELGKIK